MLEPRLDIVLPLHRSGRDRRLPVKIALAVAMACFACAGEGPLDGGAVPSDSLKDYIVMARITSGGWHSCAISGRGSGVADGTVYCWGRNDHGQLGIGIGFPGDFRTLPVAVSRPMVASEVGSGSGEFVEFTDLAAGLEYTCALATDKLYCWGGGPVGQDRRQPVLMSQELAFEGMSGGGAHICAITIEADLYCVGANEHGQLGDGTTTEASQFVPVPGHKFERVGAGAAHTCGITINGTTLCWGANDAGQLGLGSAGGDVTTPTAIASSERLNAIAAGGEHTCGIIESSGAICWGSNEYGQLGTSAVGPGSPTAVPVDGDLPFLTITAGASHTCAGTLSPTGYCWGSNGDGQVGNADYEGLMHTAPDSVHTDLNLFQMSAGQQHTCANSRDLGFCWGANDFGQAGNGSTLPNFVPGMVLGKP